MAGNLLVWINVDMVHFGLAQYIQEKSTYKSFAIIDIQDVAKDFFLNQKLVNFEKTWYYRDHVKIKNKKPDLEYLESFEKKYKINLWEIVYSEIIFFDHIRFYTFSYDEILSVIENECRLFENILDEIKPSYFLTNAYSSHSNHLLCKMCQHLGVKILMYTPIRLGYRVAITSHYDVLDIFDKSPDRCASGISRSEEDLYSYLDKYSIVKHNIEDASRFDKRITKFQQIKAILQFMKFSSFNTSYLEFYGNFGRTLPQIIKRQLKLSARKYKRSSYVDKHSIRQIGSEKFVYFPLQVEPERVLSFGSPYYYNQLELLTLVAKAIPIGYKLYVKEHPMMYTTEGRDVSYYKKINSLPNVFLVHISIPPREMLQKSSLVATINGTAAMEAAFHGKPSVIFGDAGYSFLPSVHKVKNLDDLPKIIRTCLEQKVDLSALNRLVDYLEQNSFEFDSRKLEADVAKWFFHGGYIGNVEISESDMKQFLESHATEFEKLANEHITKIEQYEQNKLDNTV